MIERILFAFLGLLGLVLLAAMFQSITIVLVGIAVFILLAAILFIRNLQREAPEVSYEFDVESLETLLLQCSNPKLPSSTILTPNKVKVTSDTAIKKRAKEIVEFYAARNVIIEYVGVETGIRLDLLKFRDIARRTTKGDQPLTTTDWTKPKVDLARMLKLDENDVSFQNTIPGENAFGIMVPSHVDNNVRIRNIFESQDFVDFIAEHQVDVGDTCHLNALPMVLGADKNGFVYFNMIKSPHILVAGATGSGKSVCINTILTSLLMLHDSSSLHLHLADLKDGLELTDYQDLPHVKGFYDTSDAVIDMLVWLEDEMQRRNKLIRDAGKKSIVEFNNALEEISLKQGKTVDFLPYCLVVVDEFVTLANDRDATESLVQLSAKARASGIYLILSTQKPTKNVIDTRIKANMNSRICFRTADDVESRVILDTGAGAKLLGEGDGYLKTKSLQRFQGCFVDPTETNKIIKHWKKQR